MSDPQSARRRALLAVLGWCALASQKAATAQGSATVEGGSPHRLPLAAVDDLGITLPAQLDGEPVDLGVLTLGAIDLPSGRVIGVDALLLEGSPFVPEVQAGRFPLQVVLARLPTGEERVAFVQVKLVDRPARAWTNALIEGEDQSDQPEGDLSVVAVESGVAGVFDAITLTEWRAELAHNETLLRQLAQVLRENRRAVWTWARVRVAGGAGYVFTAGLGEGEYAGYWGRDQDGTVVSLVLDFDLLDWDGLPPEPEVTT
jgi:hypothetical protein